MLAQTQTSPESVKKSPAKKKKQVKADVSIISKIEKLQRNDELVGNSITFSFADGGIQVQQINKHFVVNDNNRPLSAQQIIENINAIQWDLGAESYDIVS